MRHDHHRHAVGGKLAHDVENFADHFRVEGRGRLVEQHQVRLHRQRAGDGNALLLAAGELAGIFVRMRLEADAVEQLEGGRLGLGLRLFMHAHRRDGDVLNHRLVREEVELLEHHADALADGGKLALAAKKAVFLDRHMVAVDDEAAVLVHFEAVDAADQRGPARAAGTDHHHHLAARDGKVDALEDVVATVELVEVLHFDDGAHGAASGIVRFAHRVPRARCFSSFRATKVIRDPTRK